MGLEDYGVVLKPKPRKTIFPGEIGKACAREGGAGSSMPLTPDGIASALEAMGFARQSSRGASGPASPAAGPEHEIRLTARPGLETTETNAAAQEFIMEALIRTRADDKSGRELFESLSLRFAVCQAEGAGAHFLNLVKLICEALSLAVVYGERIYSPEVFWAFRLRANEQIRNQEETWQQLFEQDTERLAIAVDDVWGHFLKRHPELVELEPEEQTLPARKIAMASKSEIGQEGTQASDPGAIDRSTATAAGIDIEATLPPQADGFPGQVHDHLPLDMEATLPPQVARSISARRSSGA